MDKKIPSHSLEVTVNSAEDLRLNRRSIKKNAFVTIRANSYHRSTKMDTEGGSYPSWNEKIDIELPFSAKFLTVEVQCKTSSGVKTIGTADIPVSDFIGDYTPPQYLHFLSYRLRERDGDRNGIINLSVRVKQPEYIGASCRPWSEVNATVGKMPGGIATGVPVCYGYHHF